MDGNKVTQKSVWQYKRGGCEFHNKIRKDFLTGTQSMALADTPENVVFIFCHLIKGKVQLSGHTDENVQDFFHIRITLKRVECTAHNSDAFSTSYGGGVHIRNGGSFTMSGGTIQNCKSSGNQAAGGGVYVGNGQFTMNGGSITGCRAEGTSGNERFA